MFLRLSDFINFIIIKNLGCYTRELEETISSMYIDVMLDLLFKQALPFLQYFSLWALSSITICTQWILWNF